MAKKSKARKSKHAVKDSAVSNIIVESVHSICSADPVNETVEQSTQTSEEEAESAPAVKEPVSLEPAKVVKPAGETAIVDLPEPTDMVVLTPISDAGEITEPAPKKAKIADDTVDGLIENIMNSTKPLQAVINDEYTKPMEFTKVYVGQLKNVNEFSKIIQILNEKLPLKDLIHCKRACRKEVLLFPVTFLNSQNHESIQYYIEEHVNEIRDCFEYFKIIDVPAVAPKTRKQYIECGRSWSCNFHPDKYLEKLFYGEIFTEDELKDHRLYMGMAFEVARFYLSQESPNLDPSDILQADLNATVVVDPKGQSVVAVAFDDRKNNPLQHSIMLAIDNVAKTQHGGVWVTSTDIYTENYRGIAHMDLFMHLKNKYPTVKFVAKDYINRTELEEKKVKPSECPYLCTDFYVYVIREPCVMCSMALVHARAKRVFYYKTHEMGALGSKTKLHCVTSLNHRYEVFTDFV